MAVQYAPTKLRVPAGFQNLLEGLAREVLREQPDDIVVFAAQYFKNQLVIREETGVDNAKKGDQLEKMAKGEKVDIDLDDPKTEEAAVKIQAGFRGHKTREELKAKREEEEAALKIQASYRGMKAREEVKEIRKSKSRESTNDNDREPVSEQVAQKPADQTDEIDIDLNDPEVQGAALKIQSSFRGHKARKEVKSIKSEVSESAPPATESAEVTAEPDVAAPEAKAEGEEEVDIDLNDPEVQGAALKIQASFRGHKARESVKSMKLEGSKTEESPSKEEEPQVGTAEGVPADTAEAAPEKETEGEKIDIDLDDPEVNKAASLIQAGFRGRKVRKELKENVSSGSPGDGEGVAETPVESKAEEPSSQEAPEAESETQEQQEQGGVDSESQEQGGVEIESEKQGDTEVVAAEGTEESQQDD